MKDVHAHLRFLRMAPRKVRLVVDTIRGLGVTEAEHQLSFNSKHAARPILKLLKSAIANAENNFKLDRKVLFVKTITADGGPTLKRYRPRAMGASAQILKRTSHITITLGSKEPQGAAKNAKMPALVTTGVAQVADAANKAPATRSTKPKTAQKTDTKGSV